MQNAKVKIQNERLKCKIFFKKIIIFAFYITFYPPAGGLIFDFCIFDPDFHQDDSYGPPATI